MTEGSVYAGLLRAGWRVTLGAEGVNREAVLKGVLFRRSEMNGFFKKHV